MRSVVSVRLSRFAFLLLALLGTVTLLASVDPLTPRAVAQEEGGEGEGEKAAPPGVDKSGHSVGKILVHILKSVGIFFGAILLIISITLVTFIVLLVLELRADASVPPAFVEEFTDTVNKKQFKQAFELAKEDPSFVARVLTAGMSRLQYGIEDAREASFNMLESVKAGKEQLIVYLATIGTLGPLIGLVGTVFGMILSFMTLSSGTQINAQQLADDISHFFKNRLIRVTHDVGTVADDLLTQMYYNSKKAAASPAPAVAEVSTDARPVPPAPVMKPK